MSSDPHDRRSWAELILAFLAVCAAAVSVGYVHDASRHTAQRLDGRRALLAEFEDLRLEIDLAVDLEADARRVEMDAIGGRLAALQPRWRANPPFAGSLPVLSHRHGRDLLVIERDPTGQRLQSTGPEAAPR